MIDVSDRTNCRVCGLPLAGRGVALCHSCHQPFHLAAEEASSDSDCGEVWVNDRYLTLEFACDVCLRKAPASGEGEPPIAKGH